MRTVFSRSVVRTFKGTFVLLIVNTLLHAAVGANVRPDLAASKTRIFDLSAALFEEPLISTRPTTLKEDDALARAIMSYTQKRSAGEVEAFEAFLSDYPHSGWRMALLTDLGLSYYNLGYFSKAIDAWEQAWQAGRDATEPKAKALTDRAIGELLRMHARLGHADQLTALFAQLGDRPISGPATEAVDGAKQGLWMMRNNPGAAYLCGPMALENLLVSQGISAQRFEFLKSYESGPHGVTLAEVAHLAQKAGMPYHLIHRSPGQAIPVPSLVHWKLNHFAAIVSRTKDSFHVQDPTFGRDLWITKGALESEASGYFLVPTTSHAEGWRDVSITEANQVRGMGYTASNNPAATTPQDDKTKSGECPFGMCGYNVTEMVVSLNLNDTPVGYAPPKGSPVYVTLTYNQREASQPAVFSWFNVSPKWTLNWLTYIHDYKDMPGVNVTRFVAGGGSVSYSGYNSTTSSFTPETKDASVLVQTSSNPIVYERRLADGSREVYSQPFPQNYICENGCPVPFPRWVFLTQKIDPAGNTTTLNYDGLMRLTSIRDATGRETTFSYDLRSNPLLVTKITDPFNRSAHLVYDAAGRLSQIVDVLGLTSTFTYNASSLIDSMTTPYGTTTFAFGDNGNQRFLQITDPLGNTERVEFVQGVATIPVSDPSNTVPTGIIAPFNNYLNGRNTYYWDKHAFQVAPGDYTKARIKHWTHLSTNTGVTAGSVESIKYPFENRIWFNYPGQAESGTGISGTLDKPIRIGRVLDDGTTQLTQITYNSTGHVTDVIDPIGRDIQYIYDDQPRKPLQALGGNDLGILGIDVRNVQVKLSTSEYATIAGYTYDSQHVPISYTNASGQRASYLYNSAGQLIQAVDALSQTTRYEYDGLGYLTRIIDANNQPVASFTYDAFGRVASRTDSEGYTVASEYDALDRITKETYPDGTTRRYTWDKLDLASIKDRQGRVSQYTHDAVRDLIAITDPLERKTQFTYYENGSLKSLIDPSGNVTGWGIDVQNRITTKQYADGKQVMNTYESTTSRLKSVTDPLGQIKQYTYSLDDQVAGISYANAINATPAVRFSYDPYFPRIVSMTDGTGVTQYTYQPLGSPGALQLLKEDGPYSNDTIGYQYDTLGRLITRTLDTSAETFAYDKLSRLILHSSPLGTFDLRYLGETEQMTSRIARGGAVGTLWFYETNTNDRRLRSIANGGPSDVTPFSVH